MTKFDFKVGDKVRLTGRDWDREEHGVSAGDVVEVTGYWGGDEKWEGAVEFFVGENPWYIYANDKDDYGAELVQAAGSRFKVGDSVTLTGSGWGSSLAGTEQVVAGFATCRDAFFDVGAERHCLEESVDDPFAAEVVTDDPDPVEGFVELGQKTLRLLSGIVVKKAGVDAISPDHYKFGDVQVRDISGHLTSFGGQALQYVARATRLDGQNKGHPVEDLKKARRLLKWEIKRLEAQQ